MDENEPIFDVFACRGSILCKYYMNGACNKGDSCPFSHDLAIAPNTVRLSFYLINISCI
jgi:hypothetical protein